MNIQNAIENHLRNVEVRSGKSLADLCEILEKSGLSKFGEKRDFLKSDLGMSHGDANAVIHHLMGNKAKFVHDDALAEIYTGAKAALLSLHEKVLSEIEAMGEFEVAPKKGYVSLRRKKQFAMVGPATKTQVEIGLNMKGIEGTERLIAQPPGGMCQYKVRIADASDVDTELVGWIRMAFESAG